MRFLTAMIAGLMLAGTSYAQLPANPKVYTFTIVAPDGAAATAGPVLDMSAMGGEVAHLFVEATATTGATVEVDVNYELSYSRSPEDALDWYAPGSPLLLDINAASAGDAFDVAMTDVEPLLRLNVDTSPVANDGDVTLTVHVSLSDERDDNGLGRLTSSRAAGLADGDAIVATGSATLMDGAQPFSVLDGSNLYFFLNAPGQDGDEVLTVQAAPSASGPWVDLAAGAVLTADRTLREFAIPAGHYRFRATLTNPAGVDVTPSHAFLAY